MGRRKRHDWVAIRAYYEAGHSLGECRERFGISNGGWTRAVERGDVIARGSRTPRTSQTRDAVARLLEAGHSQASVAKQLGCSPSTVSHHARGLGVPRQDKCARRYDWGAIQSYHDAGHSARQCMEEFGFCSQTWHSARERGDLVSRPAGAPIEDYLVAGRRVSRSHLKGRLVAGGLKKLECEECGLTEWRGRPLFLSLHHINGDAQDNRLDNLAVLCPNCHAQTPNFGSLNRRLKRAA